MLNQVIETLFHNYSRIYTENLKIFMSKNIRNCTRVFNKPLTKDKEDVARATVGYFSILLAEFENKQMNISSPRRLLADKQTDE